MKSLASSNEARSTIRRYATTLAVVLAVIAIAVRAHAQLRAMGRPIPTTMVISKPAPGQIYGEQQTVTMGVGDKTYKFVLKDAYVDTGRSEVKWPDVWQLVRQYRPNFKVVGMDSDVFEKMQPGQTMTVKGMFTPLGQNFEVMSSDIGGGNFAPPTHY